MPLGYIDTLDECHFRITHCIVFWFLEQLDTVKMLEKRHTQGLLCRLDPGISFTSLIFSEVLMAKMFRFDSRVFARREEVGSNEHVHVQVEETERIFDVMSQGLADLAGHLGWPNPQSPAFSETAPETTLVRHRSGNLLSILEFRLLFEIRSIRICYNHVY
jgi:hypothetical protein